MSSNLGGKAPVLLWTNSSPTASFSAQTVSLDLSSYNGVIVEMGNGTSVNSRVYLKGNEATYFGGGYASDSGYARGVSYSSSGVTFTDAKYNSQVGNTQVIPLKIYGVTAQNVDLGGLGKLSYLAFTNNNGYKICDYYSCIDEKVWHNQTGGGADINADASEVSLARTTNNNNGVIVTFKMDCEVYVNSTTTNYSGSGTKTNTETRVPSFTTYQKGSTLTVQGSSANLLQFVLIKPLE